jgi:hypothetical protein
MTGSSTGLRNLSTSILMDIKLARSYGCEGNQEFIATSWCLYDKDKQAEEKEGNEGDSPS